MKYNPPSTFRHYTLADQFISHLDLALDHIFCEQNTQRAYPAEGIAHDRPISNEERQSSASMMRVNHAGEMAAQALYHGQSLTARDPSLREKLRQASVDESDHLNWCRRRLTELDERPSLLDPFWYAGSFVIGVGAGIAGDRWNLGFLAETECQVVKHLEGHLQRLPESDVKSRAIAAQMRDDEQGHADLAVNLGAAPLPAPIKVAMQLTSKIMTALASRI
ncbi:MAG: 2-polyprenyl-3-methyl-6-methoxy-1,4-benzoquinone monooxygenase [Zetaproteobacteria bacterium]|nr:2-polyprenyl-3-methyl-6-methoxy-1,4-benzoquinone monooxygenase [Zetaproteobacteria bacterium]